MISERSRGYVLGAIAAASYGLNPLFALPLYGAGLGVDSVLFYRYVLAVVMLGALMLFRRQSFALRRRDVLPRAAMGVLFSVSSLLLFESYNLMDAGIASTILFVYPVMVAVIMAVGFRERVTAATVVSIALACGGISLLYKGGDGATLNRAVAKALATMEVADAMGCVVAAPTAGSCGIVPGCLLTVAEDKGLDDAAVVKALFACSLIGAALYYHKVSFSGLGGGCQGEIGVSSAKAAGGLACLAGGTVRQVVDAGALALKYMLGLVCDRIGGSSEIPCIRRNGIGVASAICAADMALSGICSYIPADEVAEALVDCEKRLPPELRGGCGGLTSTKSAARAREIEEEINASLAI